MGPGWTEVGYVAAMLDRNGEFGRCCTAVQNVKRNVFAESHGARTGLARGVGYLPRNDSFETTARTAGCAVRMNCSLLDITLGITFPLTKGIFPRICLDTVSHVSQYVSHDGDVSMRFGDFADTWVSSHGHEVFPTFLLDILLDGICFGRKKRKIWNPINFIPRFPVILEAGGLMPFSQRLNPPHGFDGFDLSGRSRCVHCWLVDFVVRCFVPIVLISQNHLWGG